MDEAMRAWCRSVAKHIRFRYDREAVEEELYLHLEESRDDRMEAEGLSQEAAEAEAMAAMGDPVALGKELDKVHGPLLGWTWRLSRWLVIWLAIPLGFILMVNMTLDQGDFYTDICNWVAVQFDPLCLGIEEDTFERNSRIYEDRGLYLDRPSLATVAPAETSVGVYTISVLEGRLTRGETTDSGMHWYDLTCYLRVEAPFWREFPRGLRREAYLLFDDGTEVPIEGWTEENGIYSGFSIYSLATDRPNTTARMNIAVLTRRWSPQWVELRLPEAIGDFALRLNLNYREVAP